VLPIKRLERRITLDYFVGIDIAKRFFDAAVKVRGKNRHRQFPNTAAGFLKFLDWLESLEITTAQFCMEATSTYWERLAYFLSDRGDEVSVVNPACIRKFAQSALKRTKTDKVDAIVIGEFCKAMKPALWIPPAPEVKELQGLMRRMHSLAKMRQQEKNRLAMDKDEDDVTASVERTLKFLDAEIDRVQKKIEKVFAKSEQLQRKRELLVSIPGIGDETAKVVLSEVPALDMFTNARQLAAYAGLTPKEFRSGDMIRGKTRLSKTGSGRLRSALYLPAIVAKQVNPVVREFYERLLKQGKPPMLAVCAAMRKLMHIIFGVLKSDKPFTAALSTA